ncbi:type II toxin-antitoxin system HigB family toxin [Dyadobacter chenwenxiniae]|uniref:Type II toxin-antitoxin system HigB family toxin n=1 Tax=Dyadobacter chenwenxiniae TaxID=2906456 RepID=A0A9X1PLM1_9BACT|nr:type II toxin-antitoxin system HigB family toxin [Dyadobacter chenwenxiniae]MCF0063360.1 type II toxin-antitoxin system HigB family toxin [Dyadobacter chenwenxiniae]UON85261.1 type II toxin-antitoxin system HigB family toxin [Dyadobacter chenwenxiniae]
MVILSKRMINAFAELEPRSTDALLHWYKHCKAADWSSFSNLKQTFRSADFVGNDRYVFNIKGNDYRLIAKIHFDVRTVYILFIGTHAEYDKIDAAKILHKN